ncbi:protein tyrosine phosphatase receptor type Z1 [Homo sapiens]|uniref:Protein tyrosine phosphatase receptor type Z1 n=1 Tax=Homo sapiens TaxID=9606 RepID=A0A494C0V2_HUMAN|nr:protein tyrosine phosphatase receptor type Z1 [Homo sapiens]KAI4015571.1 protein tyrosine phosphatase receptor type Z1 [Homo sapiens]
MRILKRFLACIQLLCVCRLDTMQKLHSSVCQNLAASPQRRLENLAFILDGQVLRLG